MPSEYQSSLSTKTKEDGDPCTNTDLCILKDACLMSASNRISLSLFTLRISVFFVMAMWTADKFIRPEHAASVFERFYGLTGQGEAVMYSLAAIESVLLLGFVAGFAQRQTYGTVLLLHGVSTLSSFRQYLHPFDNANLLFFAAWPMLCACFTLYFLRDLDTYWRTSVVRLRKGCTLP